MALEATTGLVGTDFAFDLLSKFSHIDSTAILSVSASLPNGLSIGADGVVRGTIAQRTARDAPYNIVLTVCDTFGDVGRCILPAPEFSLTLPRTVPEASDFAPFSVWIDPFRGRGNPEYQAVVSTTDPDGYHDLSCRLLTPAHILSVGSDCAISINPDHLDQGDYTYVRIRVSNNDGLFKDIALPFTVPRSTWGFIETMPSEFHFNLDAPGSIRMCDYIVDGDVASGCGHLQATWNLPSGLKGATPDATSLGIFAPAGSYAQGRYQVNITLDDRLGETRTTSMFVVYDNRAPFIGSGATLTIAGQEGGATVVVPYPPIEDLDGDSFDELPPVITNIPSACEQSDADRQLTCNGLTGGRYSIGFNYTDPFGGSVATNVRITINGVTSGPNFLQQHWPKLVGAFFSAVPVVAGIAWVYNRTQKMKKGFVKTYRFLPDMIKRQRYYQNNGKTIPKSLLTMSHSLGMSTPRALGSRSMAGAGFNGSAASVALAQLRSRQARQSSPDHAESKQTPVPQARELMPTSSGRLMVVTENLVTLDQINPLAVRMAAIVREIKQSITSLRDELSYIQPFIRQFDDYFSTFDEYIVLTKRATRKMVDVPVDTEILELILVVAQRINRLLGASSHDHDDSLVGDEESTASEDSLASPVESLVYQYLVRWLAKLANHFVNHYSGSRSKVYSIALDQKLTIVSGLTELVKKARNYVHHASGSPTAGSDTLKISIAFFYQVKGARAAMVSAVHSSPGNDYSRMIFCKRLCCRLKDAIIDKCDNKTSNDADRTLVAKAWYPFVNFVQGMRSQAILDKEAFCDIQLLLHRVNNEPWKKPTAFPKTRGENDFREFIQAQEYLLKYDTDRGEVNYWGYSYFQDFLKYWARRSTVVNSDDMTFVMEVLKELALMPERTLTVSKLKGSVVEPSVLVNTFSEILKFINKTSMGIWNHNRPEHIKTQLQLVVSFLKSASRKRGTFKAMLDELGRQVEPMLISHAELLKDIMLEMTVYLTQPDVRLLFERYLKALGATGSGTFVNTNLKRRYDLANDASGFLKTCCGLFSQPPIAKSKAGIRALLEHTSLSVLFDMRKVLKIQPAKIKRSVGEAFSVLGPHQKKSKGVPEFRHGRSPSFAAASNPMHARRMPPPPPLAPTSAQAAMAFGPASSVKGKVKPKPAKPAGKRAGPTRHQFRPQLPTSDSPKHSSVVPRLPSRRERVMPPPPPKPVAAASAPFVPSPAPLSSTTRASTISTMDVSVLLTAPHAVPPVAETPDVVVEMGAVMPALVIGHHHEVASKQRSGDDSDDGSSVGERADFELTERERSGSDSSSDNSTTGLLARARTTRRPNEPAL